MNGSRQRFRMHRGERGGILVMFALWLPLLVLLASFVVDIGNWFVHKKHLQMQADSAALAGAGDFNIPCADTPIIDATTLYSGIAPTAEVDNRQVGTRPPNTVQMAINSARYPGQTDPDDPLDSTVIESPPCTAKMIDVKLTEPDVPWFLKAGGLVEFINAHARVSLLTKSISRGALPVAVPEEKPKKVRAYFIDESTGNPIAQADLTNTGSSGGNQAWDNLGAPVPVTINKDRIGVRIAVSGGSSLTCGEPLVVCYDTDPDEPELVLIRGYTNAGSGAQPGPPLARDVKLLPGTCGDPYFTSSTTACDISVRAVVDFGPGTTDGTTNPVSSVGAKLVAHVNGAKNPDYALTYDATNHWWESSAIPVEPGSGPVTIQLDWEETKGSQGGNTCKTGNGNKCTGSFGTVHRAFSATMPRSGSIKAVKVWEGGAFLANSFERCSAVQTSCTHDLAVQIALEGSLQNAQDVNDPVHCLRVAGSGAACSGGTSQNQALDCDPFEDPDLGDRIPDLSDELARGCRPGYTLNNGTSCPASSTTLWNSAQPWDCVALQTGVSVNKVPEGLNNRILCIPTPGNCPSSGKPDACTAPNHWDDFPDLDPGDPRIVEVFLAPFGSFQGSGNENVPITGFAHFYVTGWTGQGQGFSNPCQGNGDDPVPDDDSGVIVGHFIKYIDKLGAGGGTAPCDFNGFGACVAQLTE